MGKKLTYLFIPITVIVIVMLLFHRHSPRVERRFKVRLKLPQKTVRYHSLNLMQEEDIYRNLGRLVKTVTVLKKVKQSYTKKAVFIYPESSVRVKVVVFTSPLENLSVYSRIKKLEGKKAIIRGRLISHEKYGLEILVEDSKDVEAFLREKVE